MDELSEQRLTLKRNFGDFLDEDHGFGQYPDKIKEVITKENVEGNRLRLLVDLQDLHNFSAGLHHTLLTSPGECLAPFEEALGEIVRNAHPKVLQENQVVHIGVCGELGDHRCVHARPYAADGSLRLQYNSGSILLLLRHGHLVMLWMMNVMVADARCARVRQWFLQL